MLLFVKPTGSTAERIVIPLARVYDIWSTSCSIYINYAGGAMMEVVDGTYQPKVDTARIVLDSKDEVDKIFRQFYKACNAGAGAFYFG